MYERPLRSDELYHYGVKGMHWGVRRYQNYDGTLKHPKGRRNGGGNVSNTPQQETKSKKGLTSGQKKAIIAGAAIVGTGLVAYGLYKYNQIQDSEYTQLGMKEYENLFFDVNDAGHKDTLPGFKRIRHKETPEERLQNCNTSYNLINGKSNCGNCTVVNEMRHRGIDAVAKGNENGTNLETMMSYFKNVPQDHVIFPEIKAKDPITAKTYDPSILFSVLSDDHTAQALNDYKNAVKHEYESIINDSFPDGARGCIGMFSKAGGHYFSFEKKNGKVIFENPQKPKNILGDPLDSCFMFYNHNDLRSSAGTQSHIIRYDDLEFTDRAMNTAARNITEAMDKDKQSLYKRGNSFVLY